MRGTWTYPGHEVGLGPHHLILGQGAHMVLDLDAQLGQNLDEILARSIELFR